jgi:hypothetical protein
LNLQNIGPEPVTITLKRPLFTLAFYRLEEPAAAGYAGKYQDQRDFPQDQYDYILSARTTSLAEVPKLRKEVEQLKVQVEELEERFPDPDEGLELRPEVAEALSETLNAQRDSLLTPDEAWKRFET